MLITLDGSDTRHVGDEYWSSDFFDWEWLDKLQFDYAYFMGLLCSVTTSCE